MNKRTKFVVGVSLVASAATAAAGVLALSGKKKGARAAFFALAAVEGLVGLALMNDKIPEIKIPEIKLPCMGDEEEPVEIFDEENIDLAKCAIDAELCENGDEGGCAAGVSLEIPCDEETTEEDFI